VIRMAVELLNEAFLCFFRIPRLCHEIGKTLECSI
jgi:hypothetical protein